MAEQSDQQILADLADDNTLNQSAGSNSGGGGVVETEEPKEGSSDPAPEPTDSPDPPIYATQPGGTPREVYGAPQPMPAPEGDSGAGMDTATKAALAVGVFAVVAATIGG